MRALATAATCLLTACAARLGPPHVDYGAGVATLPLVQPSTDTRRWYVPVDAGNSGQWLFFVDSGYTHTTCDDAFIAALGVREEGRSRVYGELGAIPTRKAVLPDLHIGPHVVSELVCQTRDIGGTSSIDDPDEVPVAGVIGMDLLRRFRVVFDPEAGTMGLHARDDLPPLGDGAASAKLRREQLVGARVSMAIDLDGIEARTLVDTGATDTYVDGDKLGLAPGRVREGVTVRGTGKRGSATRDLVHYDIADVRLGDVSVGPVTLTDRKKRRGASGLLGQDVLGGYRSEFDWQAGWARFVRIEPTPLPSWTAWVEADGPGDVVRVAPPRP